MLEKRGPIAPEFMPALPRPVICLGAGLLAGLAVLAASGNIRNPVRVILAGTVFSLFFGTLSTIVLLLRRDSIPNYVRMTSW